MSPQSESCGPGTDRAPRPDQGAAGADRRHAWETGGMAWDTFYLLVFAAVLVNVLTGTPGSTAVAGAGMGAMIAWYLFVGRPMWTAGRPPWVRSPPGQARAVIYVTGLFALFCVVQSQNPEAWFLAFALSPQFFAVADGRISIGLGIALNFVAAALLVYRDPTAGAAAAGLAVAARRRRLHRLLRPLGVPDHRAERRARRDHRPA
jgi:hypothetical protein